MNVMVLDAEYNQPSRKTIQIGAAVFNARNAALIDRLMLYVNPGEPITEPITKLTGIRDKDVSGGLSIVEAYKELRSFHKKHECFRNPLVWGSGFRNDSQHLYHEYLQAQGIEIDSSFTQEQNFMGFRVLDVKTVYQSVQIFEGQKHGGGLKESMARFGLEFEGNSHDALNDSLNTFRFWYHLMRIFHDGSKNKRTT